MQHMLDVHKWVQNSTTRFTHSPNVAPHGVRMLLIALTGAFMTGLTSFYTNLAPIAWVGLTPFFLILLSSVSRKQVLLSGFLVGCAYVTAVLYPLLSLENWSWHETPIISSYYPQIMWSLVLLGGVVVFGGILMSAYAWALAQSRDSLALFALLAPLYWVMLEGIRSALLGGLTWGHIGYTQAYMPFFTPLATIGTVYLLGAFVILLNVLAAVLTIRYQQGLVTWRKTRDVALTLVIVLICSSIYAHNIYKGYSDLSILPVDLVYSTRESQTEDVYWDILAHTEEILSEEPDVLLLPENALAVFVLDRALLQPFFYDAGGAVQHAYDAFLDLTRNYPNTSFIAGIHTAESAQRRYNSLVVYQNGEVREVYDKYHLLPFGEKRVPLLSRYENVYMPGVRGQMLHIGDATMRPMICSEVYYLADSNQEDVEVLLYSANEAIFESPLVARYAHTHALMRSYEAAVPVYGASKIDRE